MRDLELPGRSPVHAKNGMAATSHTLSTQTAIDVLKAGGNALDAAIAACAVQCVVEPGSTGIGGDNFCLFAPEGGNKVIGYNGSGRAPAAATLEKLRSLGLSELERTSAHSVIVPGAVDAWCRLNADHGRIPMAELLTPAIDHARNGYPVSSRVHTDWVGNAEIIRSDENCARIFLPDGKVPAVGQLHHQKGLADALEIIGREGRDAFYKGELAQEMVATLQAKGGLHTLDDFASAKGEYVTPVTSTFRDLTIHECPPNGQGVIALLLMNMFERAPEGSLISAERIHFEIEACRRAYAARGLTLADPAQADVPVSGLIDKAFAAELVASIDPAKMVEPDNSILMPRHKDTVYISVVDKDRNACSFINTLFWGWGGGITTPKHGIVLTNRGQGFVLEEGHPNCIAPGKRPLHTIIPAIVTKEGRTVMSVGVMGGEYQAMGQAQFISRYIDFGMDIQEAQDAPRWMVDPFDGEVEIEGPVPDAIVEQLRGMGHSIARSTRPVGGSQAIAIDWETGVLTGGSDPRKDGCAMGY
ncbi:gamma-glutamyltransferase [Pseudahrensia aquimaris]|uniref:Glutathione hydrolase proenzyme n=1 Tax=Pseudahrensia aquimaris TaxID=744461 RepID=A0ABW3FGQ0_9HYPH